ncbi:hypothetical protein Dimus_027346 [Dionaea muscipula]
MSTTSYPFDPSTYDELPDAASLAIVVLAPPGNTSNPTSDIPSSSNAAPGSEDDSDDSSSSSESSPLQTRPCQPTHAPPSEGANSSLSLLPHPSPVTDHDAEPFIRVEDPAKDEYYVDIMSDHDDPLAPDSEEA